MEKHDQGPNIDFMLARVEYLEGKVVALERLFVALALEVPSPRITPVRERIALLMADAKTERTPISNTHEALRQAANWHRGMDDVISHAHRLFADNSPRPPTKRTRS